MENVTNPEGLEAMDYRTSVRYTNAIQQLPRCTDPIERKETFTKMFQVKEMPVCGKMAPGGKVHRFNALTVVFEGKRYLVGGICHCGAKAGSRTSLGSTLIRQMTTAGEKCGKCF